MVQVKVKKRITIVLILAILVLLSVPSIIIGTIHAADNFEIEQDATLKDLYILGDNLRLNDVNGTVNGDAVVVSPRLIFPSGIAVTTPSVLLTELGKYTIEYKTESGGKNYKINRTLTVTNKYYSVSSLNGSAKYGTYGKVTGLKVELPQGAQFNVNEKIDLAGKTQMDKLLGFYITPNVLGVAEALKFTVKMTDAYNPNNFVEVQFNNSFDGGVFATSFVSASFNKGERGGDDDGVKGGTIHWNGNYGFARRGGFYGYGLGEPNYEFDLRYNNEAKTLHSSYNVGQPGGDYIIGLADDFPEEWQGFSSNEIFLSVTCDSYIAGNMSFIITSLYDKTLQENYVDVNEGVNIVVDYGDYDSNNYPNALKGNKYRVFDAKCVSLYGNEKLKTSVFYAYNSTSKYNVKIADNCFVADRLGVYTIEYISTDIFGNEKKKLVEVNSVASAPKINMTVSSSERITLSGVHDKIEVSQIESLTGGVGKLKTEIVAKHIATGELIGLAYREFTPTKTGAYEIIYTVTDYVFQKETYKYEIVINNGTRPIIKEKPILPKYFIAKTEIHLPELIAYDYTQGTLKEIKAKIFVTENGVRKEIVGAYTATQAAAGKTVLLEYIATNATNGVNKLSYNIPVVDVYTNNNLDMSKYFIANNLSITALESSLKLSANGGDGSAEFINKLMADGFNISFRIDATAKMFDSLNFYLQDSQTPRQKIKFSIIKTTDGCSLSVNDGRPRVLPGLTFGSENIVYDLMYADGCVKIISRDITSVNVSEYLDKTEFVGFSSDFVHLTVEMSGVTGGSGVFINQINLQSLNNYNVDSSAPTIMFFESIGGRYDVDTPLKIKPIKTADVLSLESFATVTITTPSKNIMKTVDGESINDYSSVKEINIILNEVGTYYVLYSMTDGIGNTTSYRYALVVRDGTSPIITLETKQMNSAVNSAVTIPPATATDDGKELKLKVYLRDPALKITNTTIGASETLTMKGKYIIYYMAVDGYGNVTTAQCVVTVK